VDFKQCAQDRIDEEGIYSILDEGYELVEVRPIG
jgi:hypothetical protein